MSTQPRTIDWSSAEIDGATLVVDLTGTASKEWKQGFKRVLTLLQSPHNRWGEVRLDKKGIHVAELVPGTEAELRHFLESIVLEVNSELAEPEPAPGGPDDDGAGEARLSEAERADEQMAAAFRAFADEGEPAE